MSNINCTISSISCDDSPNTKPELTNKENAIKPSSVTDQPTNNSNIISTTSNIPSPNKNNIYIKRRHSSSLPIKIPVSSKNSSFTPGVSAISNCFKFEKLQTHSSINNKQIPYGRKISLPNNKTWNYSSNTIPQTKTENLHGFDSNGLLAKFNNLLLTFEDKMKDEYHNILSVLCDRVQQNEFEIKHLRSENEQIKDQIENSQRQQRLSEIIVYGLPETPNENPIGIAKKIAEKLHHRISPCIDAFRLRSQNSNKQSPLLIRLSSPEEKKALFKALHANKGLTVAQLYGDDDDDESPTTTNINSRIFINESLTPKNSALLQYAIQLKKEGILFSVRTKNGFVFIKKSSDDTEMKIDSNTL